MTEVEREELREMWCKRVAAYRTSGESAAAWCAAHELKIHQLYYWIRRFQNDPPPLSYSPPKFLPVQVAEDHRAPSESLLVRVGMVAIEVRSGYDPQLLRDLLQTLAAQC